MASGAPAPGPAPASGAGVAVSVPIVAVPASVAAATAVNAQAVAVDRHGAGASPGSSVPDFIQQRVAAARALIGAPEVVIADEPTSALDTDRREQFLQLLFASCAKAHSTLVFVSHDHTLMPLFSRVVSLAEINKAADVRRTA